jgi:23S rRNA U2552 (ribose-2'-O)-methylase RlmE/FtsJ
MSYYTLPSINHVLSHKDINIKFDVDELIPYMNKSLALYLKHTKELIHTYYNKWDYVKSYTNPYEFIHTPYEKNQVISKLKPISRAYYKMIEICKVFEIFTNNQFSSIKSFHLAEGPGGFIEALAALRQNQDDIYYGMTLINNNNNTNIPGWTKARFFLKKNPNVNIEYGKDNTGNLYSFDNIKYCYSTYGNSMNIITGDGGFDFSIDYNKQEQQVMRLIFSQISYAILMQKKHGTFILKVFDILLKGSVDLLFILSCFYENVHIYKPNTSRYANSEKYIICKNFKFTTSDFISERLFNIFQILENIDFTKYNISTFLNISIHSLYITKLQEINAIYGQQQLEVINDTIGLIQHPNRDKMNKLKEKHLQKSIAWCTEYDVPHNPIKKINIFTQNYT